MGTDVTTTGTDVTTLESDVPTTETDVPATDADVPTTDTAGRAIATEVATISLFTANRRGAGWFAVAAVNGGGDGKFSPTVQVTVT